MAKKRNIGAEILQGLRELKRGEQGRVTLVPGVAAIRATTGLSQAQFAKLLGVSVRTLQDWEQGRRAPVGRRAHAAVDRGEEPANAARRGVKRLSLGSQDLIRGPLGGMGDFGFLVEWMIESRNRSRSFDWSWCATNPPSVQGTRVEKQALAANIHRARLIIRCAAGVSQCLNIWRDEYSR